MSTNPITTDIDFERDGLQHGFLKLPHSADSSAWGAVMIPICVAKNGDGPTALLTGANHGDEYEGPIALMDLARRIDPAAISGRVIMVPMMNQPAFAAGKRTSPIDNGNLNRAFPGRPDGTVTEKIADYFQTRLLPLADVVLDIHSGGRTLEFVHFCAVHELDDAQQQVRCTAAMTAFNAPYGLVLRELDAVGLYDTAAEAMGKTFLSTELGGGGTATVASAGVAKKGVANLFKHMGILPGDPDIGPSQILTMPETGCYITSESAGLVEFLVDLGGSVRADAPVLRVHSTERTGGQPRVYKAAIDGILTGRHFPGLTHPGDTLAMIAVPQWDQI
ncbi:MAG: N-alpha-acetyl diaminobutyric acid deacetylase DoeB [Rhodospirillaceae bacterium]|nr:N-alpha-acetyl diaminobutyric acid deacetylase DoeB [Rhodospirillaceae bacterium]